MHALRTPCALPMRVCTPIRCTMFMRACLHLESTLSASFHVLCPCTAVSIVDGRVLRCASQEQCLTSSRCAAGSFDCGLLGYDIWQCPIAGGGARPPWQLLVRCHVRGVAVLDAGMDGAVDGRRARGLDGLERRRGDVCARWGPCAGPVWPWPASLRPCRAFVGRTGREYRR